MTPKTPRQKAQHLKRRRQRRFARELYAILIAGHAISCGPVHHKDVPMWEAYYWDMAKQNAGLSKRNRTPK